MRNAITLFILALWAPLYGQEVQEELKVVLESVNVRVVDKQGKPIRGLTADQFNLIVKRKKVPFEHFEEIDLAPAQIVTADGEITEVEAPTEVAVDPSIPVRSNLRTTAVLFDSSTMSREAFEAARTALMSWFNDSVTPKHRVKLMQIEGNLRQLSVFTHDADALRRALFSMEYKGTVREQLKRHEQVIISALEDLSRLAVGNSRLTINQKTMEKKRHKDSHLRVFTLGLNAVYRMLAPQPGHRAVLLVTGGGYVDTDTEDYLEDMARAMNTENITIHSMLIKDPRNLLAGDRAMLPGGGAALETQPFIGGLGGGFGGDITSKNTVLENDSHRESGPDESARQTGGAFFRTRDHGQILAGLQTVEEQATHYYTIWYKSRPGRHKVKVKFAQKMKGAKLRYGREVEDPVPYEKLKGDDRQIAFLSTLQYGAETTDTFLPADWRYLAFGAGEAGGLHTAVKGILPIEEISEGRYEIGIALLDEARQALVVRHRTVDALPKDKAFAFFDVLTSGAPATYLSCTLRHLESDRINQQVFALEKPEPEALAMSSIMILDPSAAPEPMAALNSGKGHNPFAVSGGSLRPSFEARFSKPGKLHFYLQLEQRMLPHEKHEILVSVVRNNRPLAVPAQILLSEARDQNTSYYLGELLTDQLEAGAYTLYVKAAETDGDRSVIAKKAFIIQP